MASAAIDNGAYATTNVSKTNAFQLFLDGIKYLGDHNVPDTEIASNNKPVAVADKPIRFRNK